MYRVNACAREIVTKRADARADTLLQWPGRGIRTHYGITFNTLSKAPFESCAFEVHLRDRLLEATRDAVALAEACLKELRRQEALFYAPYKPGDRVLVEYQATG